MILFIDTNILLDVIQDRLPYSVSAIRVWKLVEERALVGYVSAISFNNVYYVTRKQLGDEKAREAVKLIRQIFQIVPLDEMVIDQAIAATMADFEDAIQAAAASRVSADYIVTRNAKDFDSSIRPAVTTDEILAVVQSPWEGRADS